MARTASCLMPVVAAAPAVGLAEVPVSAVVTCPPRNGEFVKRAWVQHVGRDLELGLEPALVRADRVKCDLDAVEWGADRAEDAGPQRPVAASDP